MTPLSLASRRASTALSSAVGVVAGPVLPRLRQYDSDVRDPPLRSGLLVVHTASIAFVRHAPP